ncbi:hypothetical protein AAVH_23558 [Aphelenchoides avenae]|nr:hypothetical protein AAVH_23558 [Aphelenchus avenae]
MTKNFLNALICEQVVALVMSEVSNIAYTVCLVSECAYEDELFGLHDTLVCAQFVVTHVFMVIVLKPLRDSLKQWTGAGITRGIFFSLTSRRVSAMQ